MGEKTGPQRDNDQQKQHLLATLYVLALRDHRARRNVKPLIAGLTFHLRRQGRHITDEL